MKFLPPNHTIVPHHGIDLRSIVKMQLLNECGVSLFERFISVIGIDFMCSNLELQFDNISMYQKRGIFADVAAQS